MWGVVSTVYVVISLLLGDTQVLHVIALLAPSTPDVLLVLAKDMDNTEEDV
jgi:hypothetical protein